MKNAQRSFLILIHCLVIGCASNSGQKLSTDQEAERAKQVAIAALNSPSAWKRVRAERITKEPFNPDLTRVGSRYYVPEVDTITYRKGERLIIVTVLTGVNYGMHEIFVDVCVSCESFKVVAMKAGWYP